MAEATTIDLCSIPPDYIQDLLDLPFTYNENAFISTILEDRYSKFLSESDALFSKWLEESNKQLLSDIDNFVNDTLASRKSQFFTKSAGTINIVTVVLGMQISDHSPTIDMIEKRTSTKIHVIRLPPNLDKKSTLVNLFEELEHHSNTLVIVERIETFKPQLLEALILLLSDALRDKKMTTAIVMICMSGSWKDITQTLAPEIMNKVGKLQQLVKDPERSTEAATLHLLESTDKDFKIGPNLFILIDLDFFERDASLANLRYLYQYSMFEHLSRRASLLASGKDKLKKLAKLPIEIFRELPSVRKNSVKTTNLIDYCTTVCKNFDQDHMLLFTQMKYYFTLLRDEARINFPTNIKDIYIELAKYDNLGKSSEMYDAIERLKRFPPDRIRSRLAQCPDYPLDISTDMIQTLHCHTSQVKNPMRLPLNEAVYFDNVSLIRKRCLPSTRQDALKDFTDKSTHFGVLYSMIYGSTETISLADLYEDFKATLDLDREGLVKAIFLDLIDTMEYQGLIKKSGKPGLMKKCVWL